MKVKARTLTDAALDYAVAKCEGWLNYPTDSAERGQWWHTNPAIAPHGHEHNRIYVKDFAPSTNPAQAYPIIDQHGISVIRCDDEYGTDASGFTTLERIPVWAATIGQHSVDETYGSQGDSWGRQYGIDVNDVVHGRTPLEAAMRCRVISALSRSRWHLDLDAEIDIPEELCK